ncbi:hypothetical protein KUCAC02_033787 [Chaenocephalus aceratus]|nr:hypothetical protein KUCAC02_033787 [Chaenocephalus aceratus]
MAESRDMPLRLQYLLQNIIMAGCMRGIGSGFITWEEAMGNQWVYEYQDSSLRTSGGREAPPSSAPRR